MKKSSRANKSLIPIALKTFEDNDENRQKNALKQKMLQQRHNGRKEVITNQVNYTHIENPFKDYSMTLQTLKKERHEQWLEKKKEKQNRINDQIREMERKLDVYKRYRDDFGVDFTQTERDKILNNYDRTGVEVLVGKKMFR